MGSFMPYRAVNYPGKASFIQPLSGGGIRQATGITSLGLGVTGASLFYACVDFVLNRPSHILRQLSLCCSVVWFISETLSYSADTRSGPGSKFIHSMNAAVMTLGVALALVTPQTQAWGGLFNRFSPEMLSNLGYGGHGGMGGYRAQPYIQRYETPEEVLQDLEAVEELEEPCYGRKCGANEHCCPGYFCIATDGLMGYCLFIDGLKQGEICHRTNDCEKGLICQDTGDTRTCQTPLDVKKQYSEDCMSSTECDISKGLCCQLQRRHRQAPRKVCSYFKDPLVCSGPVATDQIVNHIEHTAGEKRLTGKMNHYNHIRK